MCLPPGTLQLDLQTTNWDLDLLLLLDSNLETELEQSASIQNKPLQSSCQTLVRSYQDLDLSHRIQESTSSLALLLHIQAIRTCIEEQNQSMQTSTAEFKENQS